MRLTALVLAAGLLWPASTFAQDDGSSSSSYLTGNKLYEECTSQDYSFCLGYVMGVSDALNATKPNFFCAPLSIKANQELAVVVKYRATIPILGTTVPGPTSEWLLRWRFPARSRLTELSTT
jgi:hypothetical protein